MPVFRTETSVFRTDMSVFRTALGVCPYDPMRQNFETGTLSERRDFVANWSHVPTDRDGPFAKTSAPSVRWIYSRRTQHSTPSARREAHPRQRWRGGARGPGQAVGAAVAAEEEEANEAAEKLRAYLYT